MDWISSLSSQGSSRNVWTATAVVTCLALFQLFRYKQQQRFRREYGEADHELPFSTISIWGLTIGPGIEYHWKERFKLYKNNEKELLVLRPKVFGDPYFFTNSPEVLRQVNGQGWDKPEWGVEAMRFWGENLVSAKGETWKRHRRILQPAFNSKTYEMVWNESNRFYREMIATGNWPHQSGLTIDITDAQKMTGRFTLCVILSCGFGIKLGWDEKVHVKKDDPLTLDDGIHLQGSNILLVTYAPKWILNLPFKKLRFIRVATDMMRSWFKTSLAEKRALTEREGALSTQPLGGKDIFTRLVQASDESEKVQISESEIIGNTWVFFFAGHETAATVLAACFCLLAVNKEEQEIIHREVHEAMKQSSDDDELRFEAYESLIKTRAAFVEALRMMPPGNFMVREAVEDTILQVPSFENGIESKKSVPIRKGAVIGIDIVGIQYNPRLYPEPEKFKPSRWYGVTSDEAYSAFSLGNRVCIGKKFALTESVCFLANVMRDYTVEPLLKPGETLDSWKDRVLNETKCELTMTLVSSPVTFRRR
ncbi:hypothetical protein FRC20_004197 [Serendipita sp. 405]|nr:hypothetical protein FRC15_001030 [Serendipita sp. 397]KAG8777947.1 hypothetical protein FRC16_004007 [Serendipita sp. 398]KAG8842921.1 hypothetical protein FRC20_004197 [Serendipita sp. 405]